MLGVLGLVVAACDMVQQINTDAYRDYHQTRWQAAVDAYAHYRADYEPPAEPPMPVVCQERVHPLYGEIVAAGHREHEAWQTALAQSETSLEFAAEMLEVLVGRDVVNIEKLAPQIDDYAQQQESALGRWQQMRQQVADGVAELKAAWDEVWPKQDLDFDLMTAAAQVRQREVPALTDVRAAALELYYHTEYTRLAIVYLSYEAEPSPIPKAHVPEGCEALSEALNRLEAGLLVRYSMDEAIERDVERVQQLALVDLSKTPWDQIRVPKGRYTEARVAATIARLKLLKYVDTLAVSALDVILREVDLQWQLVWPENELDTNVFSYAGLPQAPQPLPDPLKEMTFRK